MTNPLAPLAGGDDAHALGMRAWTFDPTSTVLAVDRRAGAVSFPAVFGPTPQQLAGELQPAFGGDFFERVHYSWLTQDLGDVIGLQTVTLNVWNAFLRAERLLSVTASNAEGVTASGGPPSIPYSFNALQEVAFVYQVTTEGPANLRATYSFDWQTTDGAVSLIGSRITGWSFVPDWSNGVVERMEWLTDVLQSYDGREQRRALRKAPRKTYEFEFFAQGAERRYAEVALWGWGARNWALPVWSDGRRTTAALAPGDTEILCETATRDFEAGSLVMLLRDAFTFEVAEVEEVQADRVILVRGLTLAWPEMSELYPARTARIADRVSLGRWSSDASGARLAFDVSEPVDYTANAGATTYRGYPVLTQRPNWAGGLSLDLARKMDEIDAMTGPRVFDDESGLPMPLQRMRWTLTSRTEVDEFRQFVYAMRGRHGSAWVPTWSDDLQVTSVIDEDAASMDVEYVAYIRQIDMATGRRDLRIETTAGAVFYRRVLAVEQIGAIERLTLDSALGVTLQPAQIASVSFLALMRFDSDGVELAHWTDSVAEVALPLKGFQHDV